jgi:hypothetical protein
MPQSALDTSPAASDAPGTTKTPAPRDVARVDRSAGGAAMNPFATMYVSSADHVPASPQTQEDWTLPVAVLVIGLLCIWRMLRVIVS